MLLGKYHLLYARADKSRKIELNEIYCIISIALSVRISGCYDEYAIWLSGHRKTSRSFG
jgi:hypothetical protein